MSINFLKKLNSRGTVKVPWLTAGLTLMMIGLFLSGQHVFDLLLFSKDFIVRGEYWRLLTAHFVHCNGQHLLWDLIAFLVIGSVIEINNRRHFWPCLLSSCLAVSGWMFFIERSFSGYCGLSGALNGMLVLAAVLQYRRTGEKMCLGILIATLAKIVFELSTHETIFTDMSVRAVPGSHAAGYLAGILYILLNWLNGLRKAPRQYRLFSPDE